jgi:hypothetical protein
VKLYLNPPSPYARKVVVVAHEMGLADQIEILKFDPWSDPKALLDVTPLCKVPALKTPEGTLIVESGTICEYLMQRANRPLPSDTEARFDILGRAAIAHGMMDAAFISAIEKRRPPEKQWQGSPVPWPISISASVTLTGVGSGLISQLGSTMSTRDLPWSRAIRDGPERSAGLRPPRNRQAIGRVVNAKRRRHCVGGRFVC